MAHIGGDYFMRSDLTDRTSGDLGLIILRGGNSVRLTIIDEHVGDSGRFGWHVFGTNIAYARSLPTNPNQLYIYKLFSPKTGYHVLSNRYVHHIKLTESRLILFHTSEEHESPDTVTSYTLSDLNSR